MKGNDVLLSPENSELGKKTSYDTSYNPDKLFPILRASQRANLGILPHLLPFEGFDLWNHFEVSWLNQKGKPIVAFAEIIFPVNSPYLIESKSMKLYFNSLNNTQFENLEAVQTLIQNDLQQRAKSLVWVKVIPNDQMQKTVVYSSLEGYTIDHLDVTCSVYTVDPTLLRVEDEIVEETLCSNLLRSNCLVTGQPDWGSLQIAYEGRKINQAGLLGYIVSYRNHNEFGEHCAERIFKDIMQQCQPKRLLVTARYTRRGGIDINCFRANYPLEYTLLSNWRLARQ